MSEDQVGRHYPSDLSNLQWQVIKDLIPDARQGGRPRSTSARNVVNAVFYVIRTGCAWRYLPGCFPPWQTVYDYFSKWKKRGVWALIHNAVSERVRIKNGREPSPSILIVDSQSSKAQYGEHRGYDGFKKVRGRKRQILVDTLGLIHGVRVHAANLQDRDEATHLLKEYSSTRKWTKSKRLKQIYADNGYNGIFSYEAYVRFGIWPTIRMSRKTKITDRKYSEIWQSNLKPKRWIVERTLAWFNNYRRLARDYERTTSSSETMILIAMVQLMLRRLAASSSPAP